MSQIRLNKYVASRTGLSRRYVDYLLSRGLITINNDLAELGQKLSSGDQIDFSDPETNQHHSLLVNTDEKQQPITILLNKPAGYVCSRDGQGSPTVYELLPEDYLSLKVAGRLDKDSSGLVLLSNDGELINELTHPKYQKTKVYEVLLDRPLQPLHQQMINDKGISLEDGLSKFIVENMDDTRKKFQITMKEGRNRQIRRTFEALNYQVIKLHRTKLGNYDINQLSKNVYARV
ncbi:hypothetical protein A3F37_02855 [Candidatus Saccharibacteria bacterium RIFCSPHIGHO2_12_FULL_41_12]|nr:MAG: hypothetical protein A3F37_02855 [Candidatus Saccharibacteria bacterium RIFCSPHIGHO2_12_FULL_41_12]